MTTKKRGGNQCGSHSTFSRATIRIGGIRGSRIRSFAASRRAAQVGKFAVLNGLPLSIDARRGIPHGEEILKEVEEKGVDLMSCRL